MDTLNSPVINTLSTIQEEPISAFLDRLFPEQEYRDKTVRRTLSILGNEAEQLNEDEIKTMAVETEYLCEAVLDTYERQIFDGKTLQELLNEG